MTQTRRVAVAVGLSCMALVIAVAGTAYAVTNLFAVGNAVKSAQSQAAKQAQASAPSQNQSKVKQASAAKQTVVEAKKGTSSAQVVVRTAKGTYSKSARSSEATRNTIATVKCQKGERAVSGGFSNARVRVVAGESVTDSDPLSSYPYTASGSTTPTGWTVVAPGQTDDLEVYAVCMK